MERLYEITPEIRKHILSYLAKEVKETFTVIYGARLDITADVIYDVNSEQGKKCLTVDYGRIQYNKSSNSDSQNSLDFHIKTMMNNTLAFSKENDVLIVKCSVTAPEVLMSFMQIAETLNTVKQDNFKVYVLIKIKTESERIAKTKNSIRVPIELPEGSSIWIRSDRDSFRKDYYLQQEIKKIGTTKVKIGHKTEVYLDTMRTGGDYAAGIDFLYSEKEVEYQKKNNEKKDELLKTIRSNIYGLDSLSIGELEKIVTILTNQKEY